MARNIIEIKPETGQKDLVAIVFCLGAIIVLFPITMFQIYDESPSDPYSVGKWVNIIYTFRFFFFVFLIVILASATTSIWKKYKVNYVYIFGINIR